MKSEVIMSAGTRHRYIKGHLPQNTRCRFTVSLSKDRAGDGQAGGVVEMLGARGFLRVARPLDDQIGGIIKPGL